MTVDAIGTNSPTVFDAELPTIAYEHAAQSRRGPPAHSAGPSAGADRAGAARTRSVELRAGTDSFARSPVLHAEGICACGARHHQRPGLGQGHRRPVEPRRRRSQSAAPTRLQGVHPTVDRATEDHDRRGHHRAGRPGHHRRALRRGRRHRPPVSDSDHQRVARRTTPRLATVLRLGRRHLQGLRNWNVANDAPVIMAAFDELDAYVEDMIARRRHHLTDDLISELIRAEDDGDRLTADELVMLAEVLLMAGTDTTRNQLARRRAGSVRSPRAVGPAGCASRARAAGSRGAHAL